MNEFPPIGFRELDDLRVIGLSRIPRCAGCPRFRALERAVEMRSPFPAPLPAASRSCVYRVCQPMAARLSPGDVRVRTGAVRTRTADIPTPEGALRGSSGR